MSLKKLKWLLLFVFMISVSFVPDVQAGFFNGKTQFYTIKTKHFNIHFPEDLGPVAEEMRVIVEEVHDRLAKRLQWKPGRRTHVVLTNKSELSNGVASVLPDNYILLYTAIPTPDSSLDHYKDYYRFLFTHEYTHILHIDQHHRVATLPRTFLGKIVAPNGATPAWMREGMAVYEESVLDEGFGRNHSPWADMYLRTSYYEREFPRIDQVAGLTRHFPGGLGPYLFGGRFFQWLAEHYGEDRMYQYQKEYASGMWMYSLNNKARRVYGKSFYKLWDEFRQDLSQQFEVQKQNLQRIGLTPLRDFMKNKNSQTYFTPHPNGHGYAYYRSNFDESPYIVIDEKNKQPIHKIKRKLFGQMSFSKTGRYLAFATFSGIEKKRSLSDVYYYDLKKRKLFRIKNPDNPKKSLRVMDPDFSPADGGHRWLVMVRTHLGTDQLYIYDLFEKKGYAITNEPKHTQFSNPRFSPDGRKIVVSRKDAETGDRDIVVYSKLGKKLLSVTKDSSTDLHPSFSNDGRKIYFSSSRNGVFNVYEYDIKRNTLAQLTNVLTGVFQPMVSRNSDIVFVQTYSSDHTYVQTFDPHVLRTSKLPVIYHYANLNKLKQYESRRYAALPNDVVNKTSDLLSGDPVRTNLDSFVDNEQKSALRFGTSFSSQEPETTPEVETEEILESDTPQETSPDSKPILPVQTEGRKPRRKPDDDLRERSQKNGEAENGIEGKLYPSSYKNQLQSNRYHFDTSTPLPSDAKKYSAFPYILRPNYLVPNVLIYESAVLASLLTGHTDPLYRHSWTAFVDYRTDAQFVGGGGTYVYSRWDPTFYVGGLRYVVDWGTLTTATGNVRFFEERWQTYAGASYNWKKHVFNATYFYEHRSALTQLANVNLINMKPYAGVKLKYKTASYKKFPNSISQEDGYYIQATLNVTDEIFLADAVNEEVVGTADLRYYFEMPWSDHHVVALRVAGGWQWGDIQQFGTFRLGGPFGEGTGAAQYSSRVFPLRGLAGISYGGDRVFIYSAEYRLPLVRNVNTGIGTWPIFLDKIYVNFFSDGGDIKFRTETDDLFSRMLISVGAELKGDFVFGYGLPITTRLGYGLILTNRDRLGNLQDSITQSSLKYGSVYLQVGTSF